MGLSCESTEAPVAPTALLSALPAILMTSRETPCRAAECSGEQIVFAMMLECSSSKTGMASAGQMGSGNAVWHSGCKKSKLLYGRMV